MVIVEHRVEYALALADRVLVLGPDGAPLALGAPREVLRARHADLRRFGVWLPEVADAGAGPHLDGRRRRTRLPLTIDEATLALAPLRPPAAAPRPFAALAPGPPAVTRPRPHLRLPRRRPGAERRPLRLPGGPPHGRRRSQTARASPPSSPTWPASGARRRGAVDVLGRDGYDLARRPQPDLVGFVFQNPEHQFLTNRVFDEVAWGPRRARLSEAEVRARTEIELSRLGLAHLAGANPYKLSGGEKRRLSLATALVLRPRLLVLDEPTFGQDANTTDALLERLRHLLDGGTTVVDRHPRHAPPRHPRRPRAPPRPRARRLRGPARAAADRRRPVGGRAPAAPPPARPRPPPRPRPAARARPWPPPRPGSPPPRRTSPLSPCRAPRPLRSRRVRLFLFQERELLPAPPQSR